MLHMRSSKHAFCTQGPYSRWMKFLLAAPLIALAFPAAAVYKCQGADGRTSFQEIPCAAVEKQTEVRTFASPAAPQAQAERPAVQGPSVNEAIAGRYPVRGMTLGELQSAMGDPVRVDTGDYEGGYTERRTYQRPGATIHVYTEDGIVRSVQTSQNTRVAQRPCPSAQDIRNEEVSANSISLNSSERRERQRRIQRMKACSE